MVKINNNNKSILNTLSLITSQPHA